MSRLLPPLVLVAATLTLPEARAAAGGGKPADDLARGFRAYRAGDYHAAARALAGAVGGAGGKESKAGLRNEDWALFLLAESEFYDGDYRAARGHFERAARGKGRIAAMAPARAADCLWMEGERAAAAAAYAKVARGSAGPWVDRTVARFRMAEVAGASKGFLAIAREVPGHPLADEALRRAGASTNTTTTTTTSTTTTTTTSTTTSTSANAGGGLSASDRLKRAETLTKDRHWPEALAELEKVPADVPAEIAVERDYQIGMTKFQMRRDYARAAELLLGVAPKLSGEKAASAAFHGARALSRVDRDDEAIAGYRRVVAEHGRSRWAAEAQYLSGWLDYNRGRFKESLPGLQATLDKFGKSAFADDAAWCLAFAHYLLGDSAEAFAGLDRYARMPVTGMTPEERAGRVAYWRARLHDKLGHQADAQAGYQALVRREPLSFYGLLAAARLAKPGAAATTVDLPAAAREEKNAKDAKNGKDAKKIGKDPTRDPEIARLAELADAGLDVEAGWELEREEKQVLSRLGGGDGAMAWLLGFYARTDNFHRAYQLAEAHGASALAAAPEGRARLYWEAAYPRAYRPLVEKYGPPAGNPDVFLYAIMRKESGFSPHDVSYADARGLLQMIPPTSARVAATAGITFEPDELYDPDVNVRLGAAYIGSLIKKFAGQVPLAAGAYNAGPRAMARWCDQHGKHPTDEFVELIAFAQTREYAKRVTALYARYRFLYGPTPYKIPLTIDPKYASAGPDY